MAVLILVRVAYSVFLLPYAAFGAEVARDYTERSTLMTLRTFFNIVGVIICQILGFGIFFAASAGGVGNHANYAPFGWTCAVIVLIAVLISWASSLRFRHLAYDVTPASQSATARLLREFGEVFRNRSFIILFITVLTFWISQGAAAVLFNHTFKFFWAMEEGTIGYVAVSGTIGAAAGIPICGILLQYFEKRDVSVVGLGAFCMCQFLPATLYILGLMPGGDLLIAIMCGVYFIIGVVAAAVGISFGSMMMDAADEHELLFGSRREGLYFAGLIFSAKAAIAGGLVFAGIGLDLIGFPAGIANTPGMRLEPETARNLGIMSGPAAAILSFTSVMVLMRYQLVKAKLTSIQKDLADRRAVPAKA
jgi:GPH family glycoside/pentoside/hexuronide:cation symporter